MANTSKKIVQRTVVWPGIVSVVLWAVALVIAGASFVSASQAARVASDGARIPENFLGLPLFVGFHTDGRFGVHPEWGLIVFLIVPAVVGIAMAVAGVLGSSKSV